ncbi:AAA family ATPase [Paraburkholderia azotifigens]|uniref:AAA family ATPase n=1 Tax=Paraburkholderia azotifigens TaxID=2057004 RepID=A0A5C6VU53_9BURK|nr:AAA family ATPase [Paraburkholderia azotifigens]TXC88469.1 AAA family ATPase [Paraburkholderia azotifigens]
MPISQQKLIKLEVAELKNLRDVELSFGETSLTAIMGANGCGKSTVLHALACSYSPPDDNFDFKFPMFFKPSTEALWAGSSFTIHYEQRDGATLQQNLQQRFSKAADRWAPRYDKRPIRHVRMVTIRESVPEVEALGINAMVHYQRSAFPGEVHNQVRDVAGQVLNRQYAEYHQVQYRQGGRSSIAVTNGALRYAAISMSAGEQRVFRILDAVFSAPNHSLILIDEIDLFLHQDALKKLLDALRVHCDAKHKQLVFTTHFPPIADMYETIAVKTIHRVEERTLVWQGHSYDALRLITGQLERPLRVFVEDDVAEAIVKEVARALRLQPYVHVGWYGPSENAFALGAGMVLANAPLERVLIVLDGDVNASPDEIRRKIERHLSGNEPRRAGERDALFQKIVPLVADGGTSPEQMLNRMLRAVQQGQVPEGDRPLLAFAHEIINVPERHGYVNQVVEASGEPRVYALRKLVEIATHNVGWEEYTRPVREWLQAQANELRLGNAA